MNDGFLRTNAKMNTSDPTQIEADLEWGDCFSDAHTGSGKEQ